MKFVRRIKRHLHVGKGIRKLAIAKGWGDAERCRKCGHIFDPTNKIHVNQHKH